MKLLKMCLNTVLLSLILFAFSPQYCTAVQKTVCSECGTVLNPVQSDTQPPSPPSGLTTTNRTQTTITLSWSEPHDNVKVKGYQLYRDGKKIITTTKHTYTNRDLVPGRQYVYSIKAYDSAGNISNSSEALNVSTVSDTQPPTAPGSPVVSSADFTSITLNWQPSSDNTGIKRYEIYLCGTKKASTSKTSYTCKSLSPGTSYSFTIKAVDLAENYSSVSSTVFTATQADTSAPSAPFGLKATSVTEAEVSLLWSPSSDNVKVKKYEIYCDGKLVGSSSKTTYTCKKLTPGKTVNYSIRAVDTTGLRSASSAGLSVTTLKDLKAPTTPGDLKVSSDNGTSVSLTWNSSTDNIKVKGYKLYCNGIVIATTTKTSRKVKNPSGLSFCTYWVQAFDQSDNLSEKSNTVTVISIK